MPGPTIEDIIKTVCNDSEPYKCLPYGGCYGPDSYCDPHSQAVESCFPRNLAKHESKLAYCQDVGRNISKLLHPTCRYACMTFWPERPDRPDVSAVCESGSDVWIWLYAAIAVIIFLACVIIWLCVPCKSYKKKIIQTVTFKCQDTRADGYAPAAGEEADKTDLLVQIRNSDDSVVNVPLETDVDVRVATILQIQHQQPNQTLENTNGSPQLQQPSLTNSADEVPQSYHSSENDSAMSSPASLSPSASSVSTNDDSGLSSGRGGHIDHASLVQQTPQTQVLMNPNGDFNQQSNGERGANVTFYANTTFYANASIPDGESEVVTSLSGYRD